MILETHNLTFYYRNRKKNPIIDRFELTISPGERVGLKGSSGRGEDDALPAAGRIRTAEEGRNTSGRQTGRGIPRRLSGTDGVAASGDSSRSVAETEGDTGGSGRYRRADDGKASYRKRMA